MSHETQSIEQTQRRSDAHLARVVDIALAYKERLGYPHAKAYLREQGVPAEVTNRILSSAGNCRSPDSPDGI